MEYMEDINKVNEQFESLLSDTSDEVLFPESLLEENNLQGSILDTTSQTIDDRQKKLEEIVEERKVFFLNPENQAEILLQNYIMSNPGMYLTGKQKRNLKREFLRNAKKGKYNKMFEKQAYNIPSEETLKAFQNLNG